MENNNPIGGKLQLNPIPEVVKRMIIKDSNVFQKIKTIETE